MTEINPPADATPDGTYEQRNEYEVVAALQDAKTAAAMEVELAEWRGSYAETSLELTDARGQLDALRAKGQVLADAAENMLKETKSMVAMVFHEANHLILGHQIPWAPKWVSEGLSEYFEGLNVFGKNRRVHLHKNRHKWCKYWLKNGFPIKLNEYVSLNYDQWMAFNNRDSNAAYGIGYSLVYFMMSNSKTEVILKELLWEFKKHGQNANSIETVNKHFPGGFKKFEKMWLRWLPRARKYRPLRALRSHAEKTRNNSVPQQSN